MNPLFLLLALALAVGTSMVAPKEGPGAVLVCAFTAACAGLAISRHETHSRFLLHCFLAGLLVRMTIGLLIFSQGLQEFFGGDAFTYDLRGGELLQFWRGEMTEVEYRNTLGWYLYRNWGMPYVVAIVYAAVGRNMLAVQFVNAVVGAATAPVIFLCARHIFQNLRVAKLAAICVAFFPSLVLWSAQGLKDGPIVFLLSVAMLATLKLGEKLSARYIALLVLVLYGLLSLRFYVFYMVAAAIAGAFVIGMRPVTSRGLARQLVVVLALGLGLTYMGVLRTASSQFETFGNLEAVQRSRSDLATSARSGFGKDVDVSTASGAISAVPVGIVYLMLAPFPWQVTNLRQSITLPEMLVWWASLPLLALGVWFTLKYRLRQALPILIFTTMLTLAYSIFQGNVGTAYRQRSQILVFYFIFVAVGTVLLIERREDRRRAEHRQLQGALAARAARARAPRRAWTPEEEKQMEELAQNLSEKINF